MSNFTKTEYTTDVLVIGGGMAATFAATRALKKGAKVMLVDKGSLGRSGQTPFASSMAVFDEAANADRDVWKETIASGGFDINNTAYLDVLMDYSKGTYDELKEWGATDVGFGNVIRSHMLETDVEILERTMITTLLEEDGVIAGAIGFKLDEEVAVIIRAKAVILCTGAGGFKPSGFQVCSLSFDGDAMAYRIGAKISGKEFVDTHMTIYDTPAYCWGQWEHMWNQGLPSINGPTGTEDAGSGALNLVDYIEVHKNGYNPSGSDSGGGPPSGSDNAATSATSAASGDDAQSGQSKPSGGGPPSDANIAASVSDAGGDDSQPGQHKPSGGRPQSDGDRGGPPSDDNAAASASDAGNGSQSGQSKSSGDRPSDSDGDSAGGPPSDDNATASASGEGGDDAQSGQSRPSGGRPSLGCASSGLSVHKAEGLFPADAKCGTNITGLYAAGDCLSSMLVGAVYSAGGFSIAGSATQGALAGETAGDYALSTTQVSVSDTDIDAAVTEMIQPLNNEQGYSPAWVENIMQGALIPYFVLYIKEATRLNSALTSIEFFRDHFAVKLRATDLHDLRKAHEVKNMLLNAEMKLKSSLFRTETRGNHYREDYPDSNDADWLAWVVIQKGNNGDMQLEKFMIADFVS